MPTFVHGTSATLSVGGTALAGVLESATMDLAREIAEFRVWGGAFIQRLAGLKDCKFTANGAWDVTIDAAIYAAFIAATPVEMIFLPDGITPATYTVTGWITSYGITAPSADKVSWTLGWSASGAVVRT